MSILIIPDVHHQVDRLNTILKKESFSNVVYLGDFFDSFSDVFAEKAIKMSEFIVNSILPDNRSILLYGNHDLNYIGNNPNTYCSGFSQAKRLAIRSIINESHYNKWKWFHLEGNILFSHAGLSRPLVNEKLLIDYSINIEYLSEYLHHESKQANKSLRNLCEPHWFVQAGFIRGGHSPFGGLVWNDTREFVIIDGLSQIFGHTPSLKPRLITSSGIKELSDNEEIILDGSNNVCLDTHLNHYGILNGNKLTIKAYRDL